MSWRQVKVVYRHGLSEPRVLLLLLVRSSLLLLLLFEEWFEAVGKAETVDVAATFLDEFDLGSKLST